MDAIVFEVSNEVAHKVGGIHAVIASKAPQMRKRFKEYYTIGRYDPKSVYVDFQPLSDHPFKQAFLKLGEHGIKCVYGRWVTADKVNCILVDPIGLKSKCNEIKTELWERYRVDSLYSNDLFNDCVVWGKAVGIVLESMLASGRFDDSRVICQFHEWLTGSALLHMHSVRAKAGLVFTTHATTAGRTLAEKGVDLIREVENGNRDGKTFDLARAKGYGIEAVHTMEKACAQSADVFTTVSKVTAEEAKYILGRAPDVLTLNGLAIDTYPSMEELSIAHRQQWKRIRNFALAYFSPYYNLDIGNTLFFFTAGRYELHNKGFDILIDALGKLNEKLKAEKSKKTAVFFFWVPAKAKGGNIEVLDNLSIFESLDEEISGNMEKIEEHIVESVCMGKLPNKAEIFDEEFLFNMRQMISRLNAKRGGRVPLCTMELENANDAIMKLLADSGLDNADDDRVKIIYYPTYLSSADGLLGLNYNEAVQGCHLGVFPSYYEPWGYTPLETAALAVPAVTTDQAGFGRFIMDRVAGPKPSIKVLDRAAKGDREATGQLADYMHYILNTTRKERVGKKIEAKKLSELADWDKLIENYVEAYQLAAKKADARIG